MGVASFCSAACGSSITIFSSCRWQAAHKVCILITSIYEVNILCARHQCQSAGGFVTYIIAIPKANLTAEAALFCGQLDRGCPRRLKIDPLIGGWADPKLTQVFYWFCRNLRQEKKGDRHGNFGENQATVFPRQEVIA